MSSRESMNNNSKASVSSKRYSSFFTVFSNITYAVRKSIVSLFNNQSIKDNDQRFTLASEDNHLADWEWDLETGLVHFNQHFVEKAGGVVNHNTVTIAWLSGRLHPEDKPIVIRAIREYLKSPKHLLEIVFRVYDLDHQCLTIQCRGVFARNSKTRTLGIFTLLSNNDLAEHRLTRYMQLESLMVDLSQQFLAVHQADTKKTIRKGLKLLTQRVEGVSSCLIHCAEGSNHAPNVYEWSNAELNSMAGCISEATDKELEELCNLFHSNSSVFLPDSLLDSDLQGKVLSGMQSSMVISIPLQQMSLGQGCLLLGFNSLSESWRKEYVTLLRSIADLFFIILDRESVQEKLQARQELLLENQAIAKLGSWVLDNNSKFLKCSPEVHRIFEIDADSDVDLELFLKFVHADDRENAAHIISRSIAECTPYDFIYRIITSSGALKYIQGRGQAVLDAEGNLLRRVGSIMDISDLQLAEKKLRLSSIMFETTQEGALITDNSSKIIAVNKAFTDITGYSESEALGQDPSMLKSGRHDAYFYDSMYHTLDREGIWKGEIWNKRKNGDVYPEWLSIKNVYDDNDIVTNKIAIFSDISHIKKNEETIEHLSHIDSLTGLPNKQLFHSRLSHALDVAKRNNYQLAVMYIDIDHFKNINDSLGHGVGDDVLVMIAERLKNRVRESDTLARLGGDEFILLLEQIESVEQAAYVAQSILDILAEPFEFDEEKDVFIGASLGVSFYPNDGLMATDLISHADAAMYQAKENGRNNVHFYTVELTQAAQARLQLESELRRAITKTNELQLYYQPQVSIESGEIVGAEALLRWHHPKDGVISPMVFLPVAEKSGLMCALDFWVLETACRQHACWAKQGLATFVLAINITKYSFMDVKFLFKLHHIIQKTGVDPKTIELEITEGALIEPSPQVIQTIAELKMMGFTLAIDDFGTGYSSLAYLQRFNVDKLKIDRSFVKDVLVDPQGEAITSAIISMAKSLNLKILAEGVEDIEQLEFLKEKGCEVYQGFYFSKPVIVSEFELLLKRDVCH